MPTTDKTASRILIYLTEELGDARLRAAQLQKYVADATDLIEKSAHRDHFFEVAGHLIHGIPQTVFKLSKALDASALAAARLDYEEIKQGLKPEKADELEAVMEDTRLRYLNRRSHEEPMKPKQASDILLALADRTKEAGRVPVTPLLQLIASLEAPTGRVASDAAAMAQKAEACFRAASEAILTPGKEPSRMELASLLRRVLADAIQPTAGAMAAAIFAQATSRQDVIDGFMSANPTMSKEDAEKAADEWEKNKDVVKNKTAGAGEAFQKVNPAITDEQVEKINEMHEKHKDNFKTAGALNPAAVNAFRDLLLPQVWNSLIRPVAYASGDMLDKLGAAERSHWDGELGQALIKRMPSRSSMDVFKDDIEEVIAHWYKNAKNQLAAEFMPRTAAAPSEALELFSDAYATAKDAYAAARRGNERLTAFAGLATIANMATALTRLAPEHADPLSRINAQAMRLMPVVKAEAAKGDVLTASMGDGLMLASPSETAEDKESRFEQGKPADPTENMTDEQKAEWKKQNEEHKDQFKAASEDYGYGR